MPNLDIKTLKEIFSEARIRPYIINNADSTKKILERYNANILLSEATIPTLHYFEICLRNRIDKVIKEYFNQDWLLNIPTGLMISDQDIRKIEQIILKLQRRSKKISHDDVLAQMTFGFWFSFFHRKYDPILWHRKDAIKFIFPNLLRVNRKRSYLESRILVIKEIRNRIAHHEPLWNNKISIFEAHTICHEIINAMSIEALEMLKAIDRFPYVYQNLADHFPTKISK